MPLKRCESDGKPGWKFGDQGACYVYTSGDDASEKSARRKAVRQALAIGGGKPPADLADVELADELVDALSDADVDAILLFADGSQPTDALPDGVVRCSMGGTPGFRGDGGPTSACHVHDGTPAGIRSAIAKAIRDRGTVNPPPRANADRELAAAMMETVDIDGVELLDRGGPIFGTGSPPEGDYLSDDDLREIVTANSDLSDEVHVPLKIGHSRGQRLLRNSGLFSDEQPAGGWIENIRLQGGKIVGDYKRVPRKLAELVRSGAFRKRSVELSRITSQRQGGKVYPTVISAVALLGAKAPAVRTLDDVLAWYAEQDPVPAAPVDGLSVEPRLMLVGVMTEAAPITDTSIMPTETTTTAAPNDALTDEQIQTFAQAFGIEEDDVAERRTKVLAKFAELAPRSTTEPTPTEPTPPNDPNEPTGPTPAPNARAAEPVAALSDVELDRRFSEMYETRQMADRVKASVDLAIRQGRIEPAKRAAFLQFGEDNPQGCLDALVALPVNERLFAIAGSDSSGTEDGSAAEEMYAAYAATTGVVAHSTTPTGGSQ